jgi:hypothetical protein
MFYKHWKRISLALTGFFWASCDNSSTTVAPPLYGVPPQYSSSSETQGSSSSSNDNISSSSEPMPMPVYGVQQMSCEVTSENDSTITCENGYTCIAKTDTIHISAPKCETFNGTTICPDYGINADILVKKYECDDGFTYDDKEFKKIYKDSSSSEATSSSVNESSSSGTSTESSSSSVVSCMPDGFFYKNRSERYTESQAKSHATTQAQRDASYKVWEIIRDRFKSKDVPKCLEDIQESLEESFVALYGAPGTQIPSRYKCSDGTTFETKEYLEQQAFDEEQAKKKPQYDEKYNEFYKEESDKLDKKINDCLDSEDQGSEGSNT